MSFNRKKERLFLTLILCIGLMAGIASAVGLLSVGGPGPWEYQAVGGEWVQIVGEGIYRNDSVSYERPACWIYPIFGYHHQGGCDADSHVRHDDQHEMERRTYEYY